MCVRPVLSTQIMYNINCCRSSQEMKISVLEVPDIICSFYMRASNNMNTSIRVIIV